MNSTNKPTHRITITFSYEPDLSKKSIDADIGAVQAHIIEMLKYEKVKFEQPKVKKL